MKQFLSAIFIAGTAALAGSCNIQDKMEKHNRALRDSDYIMSNLNKAGIIDRFPEKFFPRAQFKPFLDTLVKNCDMDSRKGKFVDYFTMSNNGKTQTAYIYEYILKCDSIRFIYIYDLDGKEPELFNFRLEGLEQPNKMIIDPSRQLLNQDVR